MTAERADVREVLDFIERKVEELRRELELWRELRDALRRLQRGGGSGGFVTAAELARRRQRRRGGPSVGIEWRGECAVLSLPVPVQRGAVAWIERLAGRLGLAVTWREEGDKVTGAELCKIDSEEKRAEVERAARWLGRRLQA